MSPHHVRRYTTGLLLLTASTGAFDAVSYLALDRVFTGNMTGNVLFLGFAAIGVEGIPFLNNLVALAGFVVGSMVSGRIIGHGKDDGTLPRSAAWVLGYGAAIAILLAGVMGGQVSAVKPIGNSEITTIVVTNTVANLARDSRLGGGRNQPWVQRLLAVVAMGLGAVVGAGVIGWLGGPAAMVASVAVYLAGAFTIVITSRSARRRRGAAAA